MTLDYTQHAGWDGAEQHVADGMEQACIDRWPAACRLHNGLVRMLEEAVREADVHARLERALLTLE